MRIAVVITSYKEPGTIGKAIECFKNQKTNHEFDILVSAPDDETLNVAKSYNVATYKDEGKGKSNALNKIFNMLKGVCDILILSDGDVYVGDDVVEEMGNMFLDETMGCVTGRPVPQENCFTKYGFWSNVLFQAAHRLRKKAFDEGKFIECSGYLFAFRNGIREIPLDVAEDAVIPFIFANKGYRIGYAENSKVYVKNVDNFQDWLKQKVRCSKAHENLSKYVDTSKRVKSFSTEAKGILYVLTIPVKYTSWVTQLILARLYMWIKVFWDIKIKKKTYGDNWDRIESSK